MLSDDTSLELSPQSILVYQVYEKSLNYQNLQRLDKKTFNYINEQETKLSLVVNLTEDEISTRRAWGMWVE
ncbi:hypothetical protein ACS0TY_010241 [Phlomoides rotata]